MKPKIHTTLNKYKTLLTIKKTTKKLYLLTKSLTHLTLTISKPNLLFISLNAIPNLIKKTTLNKSFPFKISS